MPDRIHGRLQALLIGFLLVQEEMFGFESPSEQHIRITPTRFRIPDVSVLTGAPADGRYPDDRTPPLLTVEIASLEEPWPALRAKLSDHLAMGVSAVIIADPYNRTVMVATQTEPLHELSSPLVVKIDIPDKGTLQIDFDELYRKLG